MSHKLYDEMWSQAINEFTDLYQVEFQPYDQLSADGKKLSAVKKPNEWLIFYANLYISYVQTFKKFEEVYDQITHPQKRLVVKKMLDNTMMRILEIRKDLVMFNVSTKAINSDFVNFDELIFSLKILPEQLELPIPKYLKKETPKLEERNQKVVEYLKVTESNIPEEEEMVIRNPVEMEAGTEIWMILVNERGRQGIQRGLENRERMKQKRKNKNKDAETSKEQISMLVIQKYLRAFIDREEVEKMRNEEMEFLGILPAKLRTDDLTFLKKEEADNFNIDKAVEKAKEKRRGIQDRKANELETLIGKIKGDLVDHETPDMKENLMYEMRNWITEYYEQHEGKELPDDIEAFYTRHEKAVPLSKEEEDAKKKAAAEKEKAAKKAADDKKKGKKTEAEAFMEARQARGPDNSKPLRQLNEEVQKYVDTWMSKDDGDNFDQRPNKELITIDLMPQIEETVK